LRLLATDRSRVAAPWLRWARGRDDTSWLRRRANALECTRLGATHPAEHALAAMIHLPWSGLRLILALWRWGGVFRVSHRVSLLRQTWQLAYCAGRLGLRPQVYYQLRLATRARGEWRHVIDPAELHHLQRDISPADLTPLDDKRRFMTHGQAHGLPVIPALAIAENGRLLPGAADLRRDLFVKRTLSYGSQGVMAFTHHPITGDHYDTTGRHTRDQVAEKIRRASRDRTLLVQARRFNHADLQGFSSGALCNYRIVTARRTNSRVEVLLAVLRFPRHSELTCAETDTTLGAAVDLATGRLHAATSKDPAMPAWHRHPGSGQVITGFVVPRWAAMLALVSAAHTTWPNFPFIGWDVADTSTGLVLLEGGCLWGGYLAQMSGNPPLGLTPFPAIYRDHLRGRP
jgi:hypothetical protein